MRRPARRPGAQLALALFGSALAAGCSALPAPVAHAREVEGPAAEQRVSAFVRDWFARLEQRSCEALAGELEHEPKFEVSLESGAALGPEQVEAWLADLRTPYPRVEFQVGPLRVTLVEDALYRARFEVERRAWDDEGALHLARLEHDWLVRDAAPGAAAIARIEERRSLPFPGTGPRIVCN